MGKTDTEENILGMCKVCRVEKGKSFRQKGLGDDCMELCTFIFCEWYALNTSWNSLVDVRKMFIQFEDRPEDLNQGKGTTESQRYSLTSSKDTWQSDEKFFKIYREKNPP